MIDGGVCTKYNQLACTGAPAEWLAVCKDQHSAKLCVVDQGIGAAQDDRVRWVRGPALGLAICRAILAAEESQVGRTVAQDSGG